MDVKLTVEVTLKNLCRDDEDIDEIMDLMIGAEGSEGLVHVYGENLHITSYERIDNE